MGQRAKPNRRNLALRVVLLLLLALLAGTAGWCRWSTRRLRLTPTRPGCAVGRDRRVWRGGVRWTPFACVSRQAQPCTQSLSSRHRSADHYPGGTAATSTTRAPWGASTWRHGRFRAGHHCRDRSRSTSESASRIAVIARANGLRRLVIVSDGLICSGFTPSAPPKSRRADVAAASGSHRGRSAELEVLPTRC